MLSLTRIEYLADQASLQRGRNYFRDRRVVQLTTSQDGTVSNLRDENRRRPRLLQKLERL